MNDDITTTKLTMTQSKKLRGATWTCPQCGEENTNVETCKSCRYPEVMNDEIWRKNAIKTGRESGFFSPYKIKPDLPLKFESEGLPWNCDECTFINKPTSLRCAMCDTVQKPRTARRRKLQWKCPHCSAENEIANLECTACGYTDQLTTTEKELLPPPKPKPEIQGVTKRSIYGATIQPDGGVLFRVWCPNAHRAFVSGTFNGFARFQHEMDAEPNGWKELFIPEAKEGDEYKYVLVLDGNNHVWRNDPRTTRLTPGQGDSVQSKSRNSVVYNPDAFKWTDQNYVPPPFNLMVLMEIHIGSFGATADSKNDGTFISCISRFDYLASLGINALEVMPLNEDYHTECWGYDPVSLFAIHHPYGSPDDLKTFINEAHKRNIAVILDWVPNHMVDGCVVSNFDIIPQKDSWDSGLYFYKDHRKGTDFGPRLDYSHPEVRQWVKDSSVMFVRDFHFDGLRVDSTITMRKAGEQDLFEAWSLFQEFTDEIRRLDSKKLLIAEDLQCDNRLNCVAGYDSQWDPNFFATVYHVITQINDEHRSMGKIADTLREKFEEGIASRIIYTENHDTVPGDRQHRLPLAIIPEGTDDNPYAIRRSVAAAVLLLTAPGIPMLLQGQEFLELQGPTWPIPPLLEFSRIKKYEGIVKLYSDLIHLRLNTAGTTKGLTSGRIKVFHTNENKASKVIAYHRYTNGGPHDDTIVIINLSNNAFVAPHSRYRIGLPRPGKWYVRLNTDLKMYSDTFGNVGEVPFYEATAGYYDMYFFSAEIELGKYGAVILSQNTI